MHTCKHHRQNNLYVNVKLQIVKSHSFKKKMLSQHGLHTIYKILFWINAFCLNLYKPHHQTLYSSHSLLKALRMTRPQTIQLTSLPAQIKIQAMNVNQICMHVCFVFAVSMWKFTYAIGCSGCTVLLTKQKKNHSMPFKIFKLMRCRQLHRSLRNHHWCKDCTLTLPWLCAFGREVDKENKTIWEVHQYKNALK